MNRTHCILMTDLREYVLSSVKRSKRYIHISIWCLNKWEIDTQTTPLKFEKILGKTFSPHMKGMKVKPSLNSMKKRDPPTIPYIEGKKNTSSSILTFCFCFSFWFNYSCCFCFAYNKLILNWNIWDVLRLFFFHRNLS